MFKTLHQIIKSFRPLFSYQKTYACFVLVLLGFILRMDHCGVSSTIRWLGLSPNLYESLLHFFHSTAWSLDHVMSHWIQWCGNTFPTVTVQQRLVLLGDNIKISKEALYQPGLTKLHQDSGNSGKPSQFWGHNFGSVALLVGSYNKFFAVPCLIAIHEGVDHFYSQNKWPSLESPSVVTRMIELLAITAVKLGHPVYAVVDAYFCTGPAFRCAQQWVMDNGELWVHLIVPAKKHYVAYPSNQTRLKEKIKLWTLFEQKDLFTSAQHPAHNRLIDIYHFDLFWLPANAWFRFVWVIDQGKYWLLMGTDLNLDPMEMIRMYTRRSKIEVLFLTLTQVIGAFNYRFWSKSIPKLNKNKSKKADAQIPWAPDGKKILSTLKAMEAYVNLACIVTGILQYIALTHSRQIWDAHRDTSWLRSYSSSIPSEQVVQRVIQCRFFVGRHDKALAWIRKSIQQVNKQKRLNGDKVPPHATLDPPSPSITPS